MAGRWLCRPPRRMPFLVAFVTFRCNMHCRMCDFWRTPGSAATDELTAGEWHDVIDQAIALGAWMVSLSGGEPLIRRDLEAIVRHAHQRGLLTHLCTNGSLLDEGRARTLAAAGLDSVNVSLDSPDPAVHNALRGRPVFETVVANVRRLRDAAPGIRVGLNCLITRRNIQGLSQMVPFAVSLGATALRVGPIHTNLLHRGKDLETFGDLVLRPADLPAVEREVKRLIREAQREGLHRNSRPFLQGVGRVVRGQPARGCVAGFATACVDPEGRVAPCPDIEGTENVREKPLAAIWRSPHFQALRRQVRTCRRPCWDTTYAELNLRFGMRSTLADPRQLLGELNFYLD